MFLVCGIQVTVFKDYNLNCHYMTKQKEIYKNLTDAECAKELEALLARVAAVKTS